MQAYEQYIYVEKAAYRDPVSSHVVIDVSQHWLG